MNELDIVVADDDASVLRLLERQLSKAGYHVHPCENGDEAFELVVRKGPVILLTDWNMPGLSGLELCQKIRETQSDTAAYIILQTSNDQPEQVVAGFQAGADDYITKPVISSVMLARVRAGARLLRALVDHESQAAELGRRAMEARLLRQVLELDIAGETRSFEQTLQKEIDLICETIGWPVGHVYVPSQDGRGELQPTDIWHLDKPFDAFVAMTMKTRFAPGVGLPGRVLASEEPAWIADVLKDDNFQRAKLAGDIGVKGALGIPIKIGRETVAVMEFFSRQEMSPDSFLLNLMQSLMLVISRVLERQRVQEQLHLQSAALASAANAIVITDRQGEIIWANDANANLTGYRLEQLLGANMRVFESGHHDKTFYRDLWETVLAGGVWTGEMINRKKDGTLYPEEMTITPVLNDEGDITHFIAIRQDISIRKQAETEIIKRLEIEQERNHLRNAVKAQERLLGVVGHELRTPLAGVRAIAELLIDEGSRDMAEFDTFLRNIHDEVVRMSGLVNDLLEVARMHSGVAQWNWSTVSLRDACEAALSTVRPLIDNEKVKLILDVQPCDLTMHGDKDAIRRLMLNLVNNACKNTVEGSVCVTVRALEKGGLGHVEIEVRDTGTGMTAEVTRRLGQAFALNSGVVGDSHVNGSGLGLAICRGIVVAHGGSISVSTVQGTGSVFSVLLRSDLSEPMPAEKGTEILCEVS